MEKKSKAVAALACAALLVLIGAGCARCTMVHGTQQDPVERGQEEGAADEADAAKDSLEKLLGTKWTSKDGKATLSIINGAFVERAADEEKVTYWEPENANADDGGFSESVWVSDSITSAQTPSLVRVDAVENGGMAITCDSFKISATYLIDAPRTANSPSAATSTTWRPWPAWRRTASLAAFRTSSGPGAPTPRRQPGTARSTSTPTTARPAPPSRWTTPTGPS